MKNVLVIKTSLRNNSNSDIIADNFIKGAKEAGNNVTEVSLKGKKIAFCVGCLSCQKTGNCFIRDDANEIEKLMLNSDAIVFATPIYYYSISGQLKTLLDRCNPLFNKDYKFRDIYLLMSAAEDEEYTKDKTIVTLAGWIDCFEKAKLKDYLFIGGVDKPDSVLNNEKLIKAYEMGKTIK